MPRGAYDMSVDSTGVSQRLDNQKAAEQAQKLQKEQKAAQAAEAAKIKRKKERQAARYQRNKAKKDQATQEDKGLTVKDEFGKTDTEAEAEPASEESVEDETD